MRGVSSAAPGSFAPSPEGRGEDPAPAGAGTATTAAGRAASSRPAARIDTSSVTTPATPSRSPSANSTGTSFGSGTPLRVSPALLRSTTANPAGVRCTSKCRRLIRVDGASLPATRST